MILKFMVLVYHMGGHAFANRHDRGSNTLVTARFEMGRSDYDHYIRAMVNSTLSIFSFYGRGAFGNGIQCPQTVAEGAAVPIYRRSTCPWYYMTDHNPNRFPATILRAQKVCEFCIGNPDLQCEKITRNIAILEKHHSRDGGVEFTESFLEVEVGYTCAGDRTVPNNIPDFVANDLPEFAR